MMYNLLCKFDSLLLHSRVFFIKLYYKLKYGKRLSIGKRVIFRENFKIVIAKNGYVKIDDYCFFNTGCTIDCNKRIIIGKHNLFGENVKIYDHNHIFNDKSVDRGISFKNYEITIGNENWFGTGIVLLGGTFIGNNNVIGANTVLKGKFNDDTIIKNKETKNYEIVMIKYKEDE